MKMLTIKSYPMTSDPLKGCALARRTQRWSGTDHAITPDPWPAAVVGERAEVQTSDHWTWEVVVEAIRDQNNWVVRAIAKHPMPLPPIVPGEPYVLPYMSGDAWSTRPERGKILMISGQPYKVAKKPGEARNRNGYEYQLTPVDARAFATRSGRVAIKDLTAPNPTSHSYYGHNVGRVLNIQGEWLHVQKIERRAYGSGEGDEIFGYTIWGVGRFVSDATAAKLQAAWEAKEKVRSIELHLRVARQAL